MTEFCISKTENGQLQTWWISSTVDGPVKARYDLLVIMTYATRHFVVYVCAISPNLMFEHCDATYTCF